jgi:hypothetical protein
MGHAATAYLFRRRWLGRTPLAHKAERTVNLETGVIVGVTVLDADAGDTTTSSRYSLTNIL